MMIDYLVIQKIELTTSTSMVMAAIRDVDRKMMMPVFVLSLSRRICRLSFSSMQYRLRFFAIFLSMIVAN